MIDIIELILKGNWINRYNTIIKENKPHTESFMIHYKAEYSREDDQTIITIKYGSPK